MQTRLPTALSLVAFCGLLAGCSMDDSKDGRTLLYLSLLE
jgi:hypothetical protein